MARVPYVDPEALTGEQAALSAAISGGRQHGLPNLYRLLLHAPGVARGWVTLSNEVRFGTGLPPRMRELVILRTATAAKCAYAEHHHARAALAAGLGQAEIDALRDGGSPPLPDAGEALALQVADAVREQRPIPAEVAGRALEILGVTTVVEVAVLTAYYVAVARLAGAMDLDIETDRSAS